MKFDIGIITLHEHSDLFDQMTHLFPDANVFLQRGVDVRNSSINNLREADIISDSAYVALNDGRKSHWELNTLGGVGIFLANKTALLKNVTRPLLLFEDDCIIKDVKKFVSEVDVLLNHEDDYDVAVFGGIITSNTISKKCTSFFKNDYWSYIEGEFILMHSVFYSTIGRKKIGEYYLQNQLTMQIDGLLSLLSKRQKIRLIVQEKNHTTKQKYHPSSIQNDICLLCFINGGRKGDIYLILCIALFLIILLVMTVYFVFVKKCKKEIF